MEHKEVALGPGPLFRLEVNYSGLNCQRLSIYTCRASDHMDGSASYLAQTASYGGGALEEFRS